MKCSETGCEKERAWGDYCHTHGMRRYRAGIIPAGAKARGSLQQRFYTKVEKTDGCWLWTGNKKPNGYGSIQEGGKGTPTLLAHRVSYRLHIGEIPPRMVVMHSCDNPGCVNPAHLSVGTYADNTADLWSKGRGRPQGPKGSDNGKAKLTDAIVRYIRANPQKGHKEIADEFGVSPNAIRGVRIGRTWRHIQ